MKSFKKEFWLLTLIIMLVIMVQLWGSQKALDVRLYYSALEAQDFFASLSLSEVNAYLRHELFDLVFIFAYSYLLLLQIRRVYKPGLITTAFALTPGFFDLLETSTILGVLIGWVQSPSWLGAITFMKWLASTLVLLAILFGWVRKQFIGLKTAKKF
ncbi:MAG: hypothetical protein ACKOX6_07550 [Bdellovibrio sp.]